MVFSGLHNGQRYAADVPFDGTAAEAPAGTPELPATVQNQLLDAAMRPHGPAPVESYLPPGPARDAALAEYRSKTRGPLPPDRPGALDRCRATVTGRAELARWLGLSVEDVIAVVGEEHREIAEGVFRAGFLPAGERGREIAAEIEQKRVAAEDRAHRTSLEIARAQRKSPRHGLVRVVYEPHKFFPGDELRAPPHLLGLARKVLLGAPGEFWIDTHPTALRLLAPLEWGHGGLRLEPVASALLNDGEYAGRLPVRTLDSDVDFEIAHQRKSARATWTPPDCAAVSRDWRRARHREQLLAMSKVSLMLDRAGELHPAFVTAYEAHGLDAADGFADICEILAQQGCVRGARQIEDAIARAAGTVWLPGELVRPPSTPAERRAAGDFLGSLRTWLADKAVVLFGDVRAWLVSQNLADDSDDPRDAVEIHDALTASGWRQGEQRPANGPRRRVWRRASDDVAPDVAA